MTAAEIAREQERGTTVDTIILASTEITLRVGEEFDLFTLVPIARDRAGQPIQGFGPAMILYRSEVYSVSFPMLRARQVGVDSLYIEALPREPTPDRRPRRPSTRILITVRQ